MKRYIYLLLLLVLFPMAVKANYIGDFYQTINVSLNCSECIDKSTKEIKLQLFANGEAVQDAVITLSNDNNFEDSFEDLPLFEDDGVTEIKYEVKFFEDGEYRSFSKNDVTYEKEKVSGWVSVLPEDLQKDHEYVLLTDNWNYELNGKDPYILVGGATFHQYIDVFPEYNLVNGKKAYFMLDGEPEDKALLRIETPSKDVEYYNDIYEDYILLRNLDLDKSLTLKAKDGHESYSFMLSSRDGYQADEETTYINRVKIEPIEDELSRFYITSEMVWSEDYTSKKWVGIGSMVELKAQRKAEYGAHFIAFEYLDDVEVEHVYNIVINKDLCKALEDNRKIALSDSFDVLGVFKDIDSLEGIDFDVLDPSILKIVDGKIIPLKIGETDISFKYAFTTYTLHVSVYDDPNSNPNTRAGAIVSAVVIAIISGISLVVVSRKK